MMRFLLERDENIKEIYNGNAFLSFDNFGNPIFKFWFFSSYDDYLNSNIKKRVYEYNNRKWKRNKELENEY